MMVNLGQGFLCFIMVTSKEIVRYANRLRMSAIHRISRESNVDYCFFLFRFSAAQNQNDGYN